MGVLESIPIRRVTPVLCMPFWMGSLRDHSGSGNHGTNTGGWWTSACGRDGFTNGEVNVSADASLQPTDITVFAWGGFGAQVGDSYICTTVSTNTRLYFSGGFILWKTNGVWSSLAATLDGCRSVAVTSTAASAKPQFYMDGASIGAGNNDQTLSIALEDWNVAGFTGNEAEGPFFGIIFFPAALTAAEIADVHNWSQSRFTPDKHWPSGGLATGDLKFQDNLQTARVTLANETAGYLSNTPFSINSGTWKVTEDADGKYIECVANGQLEYGLHGASGYTTHTFTATGATLTKNANDIQIDGTAGDTVRAVVLTA